MRADALAHYYFERDVSAERPAANRRVDDRLPSFNPRPGRRRLGAESARRGTHTPVRVSRRVRVPEHDLVEIDRLGLRMNSAMSVLLQPATSRCSRSWRGTTIA